MSVEIASSGGCGTQAMEWRREKREDKWVPHWLGHEGTGTVIETGSGVRRVKAGDKVALSWITGTGIEDGVYLERGVLAPSNAAMVEKARRIVEEIGAQIATPAEARALFDLPSAAA